MTVNIVDKLKQAGAADFSIVEDSDVEGGAHVVADDSERDAIPSSRRKEGMLVSVLSSAENEGDPATYRLVNSVWVDVNLTGVTVDLTDSPPLVRSPNIPVYPPNSASRQTLFSIFALGSDAGLSLASKDGSSITTQRLKLDPTSVTVPATNKLDFGVDLTTIDGGIGVELAGSQIPTVASVFADAGFGFYAITALENGSTTNSVAVLLPVEGSRNIVTGDSPTTAALSQVTFEVTKEYTKFLHGNVFRRVTSSTDYIAGLSDFIIGIDDTSAPRTVTLPTSIPEGIQFVVVDESQGASTNAITVDGNGANINGSPTFDIDVDSGVLWVYFDGTEFKVLVSPSQESTVSVRTTSANDLVNSDSVVLIDTAGTYDLPVPNLNANIKIKNISTGLVTLSTVANGGQIDGDTTFDLPNQYDSVEVIADGTNWNVF